MHPSRTTWTTLGLSALVLTSAHAFKITGTAPKVNFNGVTDPNFAAWRADFESRMNAEVARAFNSTIDSANAALSGFGSQKELAQGMANANVYASNAGTLQGYQNYSLFAVSSGFMLGVQAPSFDPSAYGDMGDEITRKGDLYAGVGMGFTYLNLGIHCGKLLTPGLYLNVKYGGMEQEIGDFSLDFMVFGVGASYRVLEPKSLMGLVKWRGISASTGFYLQTNKLNLAIKPETFTTDANFREAVLAGTSGQERTEKEAILQEMGYGPGTQDAQVHITPEFDMGLDVTTYTVPLEANTAVALLWGVINLNLGLGMDLNFGNAKIVLEGNSVADIEGNSDKVTFDAATVQVDGSSKNGPSFGRLRAMTGFGLGLGPVKIDVPLFYYFNTGMAFGVTAAVVW